MSKTILLVDGDLLAYQSAAIAEERSIEVTHAPTGIKKSFKNRTEFKDAMKVRGKEISDAYSVQDIQEAPSPALCNKTIKARLDNWKRETNADSVEIWVGGKDNFRDSLPLPKKYKGQRTDTIRPLLLQDAKSYLTRAHAARSDDGHETDDALIYRSREELAKGNKPVVASIDKDNMGNPGIYVYNFGEDNAKVEQVPQLGSLWMKGTTVKGNGLKFLAYQWQTSDPADFYCAYDLSSYKFGPKTSMNLLEPCKTEKELFETVVQTFKNFYPEPFEYTTWDGTIRQSDYKDMMSIYFKCCRMKQTKDDPLDYKAFLNSYGVSDE
jgi:hypothetical protein